jgi:hypothetical protein
MESSNQQLAINFLAKPPQARSVVQRTFCCAKRLCKARDTGIDGLAKLVIPKDKLLLVLPGWCFLRPAKGGPRRHSCFVLFGA